jgi:hypothetical protein
LLSSGKVLIAGGSVSTALSSAELYDPIAGTFSSAGSLLVASESHTSTLLADGTVLIAGGNDLEQDYFLSAERYTPGATTGTFTATGPMVNGGASCTATALPNHTVLITGGNDGHSAGLAQAELYFY